MDLRLNNKVVIVTGGFSSIGKAISIKLCEEGAIPCILDSDATALRAFANEMDKKGYEVFAGQTGLDSGRVIKEIISRYRRINGVVNVAGHYSVVGLAIPSLKESTGAIVNICSEDEDDPADFVPVNGLRQEMTIRWATAFSVLGIRVNGIVVQHCHTWQDESEEIANMVLFLLSQKSRLVNGELVHVDG
ncbi:MAG: SDR family NAD(P)-dependent oxidoreductase [Chitinophagaceae bacterium]|nr:SDR family NAD(P)-dependent oxidoreductase [Chitinophagaceae bacterium]